MTSHQAARIAAIIEIHCQQMRDPSHRLLCKAEPCSIALLLRVVSAQAKALAVVGDVADACLANAFKMAGARARQTVSAVEAYKSVDAIGKTLGGILADLEKPTV